MRALHVNIVRICRMTLFVHSIYPSCPRQLLIPRAPAGAVLRTPLRQHGEHVPARSEAGAKIPSYSEDKDAAHSAFMHAFEEAKCPATKIAGLQEFASAIWERRRRIPSQLYNDPLAHLFEEFDQDGDGHLTSQEIASALVSRGVEITPDQVQVFIDAADADGNHTIEKEEFADLIFHMASADLNRDHHAPVPSSEDEY